MEEIKKINDSELNADGGSQNDQRGEIIRAGIAKAGAVIGIIGVAQLDPGFQAIKPDEKNKGGTV